MMSFGERLRSRREELGLSRSELADRVGVSRSAIGNYETGVSSPKEDVLFRLFAALRVDPNYLYRDSFPASAAFTCSAEERRLLEQYRRLGHSGREAVSALVDSLTDWQEREKKAAPVPRRIPLYRSLSAVASPSPVCGQDFDFLPVTVDVPDGAAFAVCIRDGAVRSADGDGQLIYVSHAPLQNGDAGLFCVDGTVLCRQYYRDMTGMVYLVATDHCADRGSVLSRADGQGLTCLGRLLLEGSPLRK